MSQGPEWETGSRNGKWSRPVWLQRNGLLTLRLVDRFVLREAQIRERQVVPQ